MREFRDALRSLAADRRFTAAAVALLSLTIGASTAIGLTACWWPSRRAAAADPVEALRAE